MRWPASQGSRPLDKTYLPLAGPLPRPPPEGLPVVLGQLPPGPGWLEGPRVPFEILLCVFALLPPRPLWLEATLIRLLLFEFDLLILISSY